MQSDERSKWILIVWSFKLKKNVLYFKILYFSLESGNRISPVFLFWLNLDLVKIELEHKPINWTCYVHYQLLFSGTKWILFLCFEIGFFCIKEMKSNKECHAGKDFFVRVAVAVYQTITNKR